MQIPERVGTGSEGMDRQFRLAFRWQLGFMWYSLLTSVHRFPAADSETINHPRYPPTVDGTNASV